MLTHNPAAQPRWRAAYQTCDACGFQFWQEKQEQQRCRLCSASMAMPWANGQEQRRSLGKSKAEVKVKVKQPSPGFSERRCEMCGTVYMPKTFVAKYCSDACRQSAKVKQDGSKHKRTQSERRETVSCDYCGNQFERTDTRILCCSDACTRDRRNQRIKERRKLAAMMAAASARKEQVA